MLDSLEDQQIAANASQESKTRDFAYLKPFQFTRENARENARKANEKRWKRKQEQEAPPENPVTISANYVQTELARTRAQIERLNGRLDKAIAKGDAKDLKFIADSVAKLREVERVLDGRPLPGSNKPSSPPRKSSNSSLPSPLD